MSLSRRDEFLSDFVIHEVPTDVRGTMTEEQISAVRNAADRRHAVDVRFTVPLVFTSLYFVLLVGKDTRRNTQEVQRESRARAGAHFSTAAIAVLAGIAVITAGIVLYIVKSRAGIDLFQGHAGDYVPFAK